jgi:hypothetical protein
MSASDVSAAKERADRGGDPGLGQPFGERNRRVLRPGVVVMDQPGQIGDAVLLG